MVVAFIAKPHIAQTDVGGLVLQFTVVIGAARQAIERMVGDIQLHDPLAELLEARRLGVHDEPRSDGRGA